MIVFQYDDEMSAQLGQGTFIWAWSPVKDYYMVEVDQHCFAISGHEVADAGGLRYAVAARLEDLS